MIQVTKRLNPIYPIPLAAPLFSLENGGGPLIEVRKESVKFVLKEKRNGTYLAYHFNTVVGRSPSDLGLQQVVGIFSRRHNRYDTDYRPDIGAAGTFIDQQGGIDMENNDLKGLFTSDLQYMYYVEKEIVKALPDIADASSDPELKKAFVEHLEQSKTHLERLEKIFEESDLKPRAQKSRGIGGLVNEAKEVLEKKDDISPDIVDAALIAAVQRIEHYEIAAYGTLSTYAKLLGDTKTADLLKKTLDEESEADENLTRIAVKRVNPKIT